MINNKASIIILIKMCNGRKNHKNISQQMRLLYSKHRITQLSFTFDTEMLDKIIVFNTISEKNQILQKILKNIHIICINNE